MAVLPTLATTWLVPRLPDLQRLHGVIAVSLSVRTLPFQFNDHPFDGAIYHASQIWPQTVGIRLFDEGELLPVCIPELVDAGTAPAAALDGLTHLPMLSRPDAWRQLYLAPGRGYPPSEPEGRREGEGVG